ncbi:MAG: hypothetical protein IJM79_00450 [Erysipelotrichaceae bacterium]|nr:hypothetical protein [Erysipelotrichaceae bacterium]
MNRMKRKGKNVNIATITAAVFLLGALALAGLSFTVDCHDYSGAADFSTGQPHSGQPAFVKIEALERLFAYDDQLEYRLAYHGDDIYLLGIPVEDYSLPKGEYIVSADGLLTIFTEDVKLEGCVRTLTPKLRELLKAEYELTDEQVTLMICDRYLAVGQPVHEETITRYRLLAGGALAAALVLLLIGAGQKRKKKKSSPGDGNRAVFLVE